jgi:hypothetical protein
VKRWYQTARLRRRLRRPSTAYQLIARRLRAHLESAPSEALAVVEVDTADAAAVALAMLARSLASEGRRVVVADAARRHPLASLLGGRGTAGITRPVTLGGHAIGLFVAPDDTACMAEEQAGEDADVILVLATLDQALGADHIAAWASDAVVMVRAGAASAARIDRIGMQLRDARLTIRSAILVGADRDDHSSGIPNTLASLDDPGHRLPETSEAWER